MPPSDFTEFSYGFAALHEFLAQLHGSTGLVAAPVLPTLRHERRLGYDATLSTVHGAVFLQFKVAQRLTTARAREWSSYSQPYYAFDLRNSRDSQQHETLCNLEQSLPIAGLVSYVAPAFRTLRQLNNYFVDRSVLAHSLWVRPLAIGRTGVGQPHRVCYLNARDVPLLCSEPKAVEPLLVGDAMGHVVSWTEEPGVPVPDVVRVLSETIGQAMPSRFRTTEDAFDDLRRLAWTANLTVVLVGRSAPLVPGRLVQ